MPLINFRTNLTSLRYGSDRPGGGSSDQPFMQFPIEDASTPPQFKRYYEANRTGLDFPVRGGAISQLLAGDFGVITSSIDRRRIEKFFQSAPRGTAFIEKQKGLQLTNPRIQVPNSLIFAGPSLQNTFLPVTNVYNPLNTLAQVQVMGTGAHINRHGFSPTIYEAPRSTYAYIAGAPQNNTETTNRLAILKATKLLFGNEFLPTGIGGNARGIDPQLIDRMGISQFRDQIYNYAGGPGSVYGIGFTRVFRATDTGATTLQSNQVVGFTVGGSAPNVTYPYSTIALTYGQLAQQRTTEGRAAVEAIVQDFRAQTNLASGSVRTPVIPYSNYSKYNIANTDQNNIGIGNPGAPKRRVFARGSESTATYIRRAGDFEEGVDQLNKSNPFFFSADKDPWAEGQQQSPKRHTKDIIKFAFECLDNNASPTSNNSIALIFRAFLDGQITDTNQATYNDFRYLGRGETFRTYQGFDRTIGFTFKMFAQSRQEMRPMYRRLNTLMSQIYPDYSPGYNLMRGNVVRLTIGDYIYRLPGFLENVNVIIDNSNTSWEIVLNQEEEDVRQLPHMVVVQCSFKPIFNILPRRVNADNLDVPLIVNTPNPSGGYAALEPRVSLPTAQNNT